MKKAFAITVCDRVDYFRRMAESLSKNNLQGYDIFFFVDAKGKPFVEQYHLILKDAGIVNYIFDVAHTNLGCCGNIIRSRQVLFDTYEYDFVVYSDDDVILSKNFLTLNTNILEWGLLNFDNIGTISLWSGGLNFSLEEKKTKNNLLYGGINSSMTCALTRDCWNDISKDVIEFIRHNRVNIVSGDYLPVVYYMYDKFKTILPDKVFARPLKLLNDFAANVESMKDRLPAGQDMMFPIVLFKKGWSGLSVVVSRVENIGEIGEHTTTELWNGEFLYRNISLYEDDNEVNINEFQIASKE